jgi:hypothetical protein
MKSERARPKPRLIPLKPAKELPARMVGNLERKSRNRIRAVEVNLQEDL